MIQQDDEIRVKIVGTRVDAKDIVSKQKLFCLLDVIATTCTSMSIKPEFSFCSGSYSVVITLSVCLGDP